MSRSHSLKTAFFLIALAAVGCGPVPGPVPVTQVTYDVFVPSSTPKTADVYVIGSDANLGNSDPSLGFKLWRDQDVNHPNHFYGTVYLTPGKQVLYRPLLKHPTAAELDAVGGAVLPHMLTVGTVETSVELTVAQWDVPRATVSPNITFVVHAPAGTPSDANICIAGDQPIWGPWDPTLWQLDKNADGTYSRTEKFPSGTTLQFKATRCAAAWKNVEKDANGQEIQNRTYTVGSSDATVPVDVVKWADL